MDSVALITVLQRHPSLEVVIEAAGGTPICLVGGSVRDLLLGRLDGADTDLVVEGDAIAVALAAGAELGSRVSVHDRFGTAEIHLDGGGWIDLVGARREAYPVPGGLPVVTPGSLTDDLMRRDITVNAMAIRLNGSDVGEVVDPAGGRRDLADHRVRVLTDHSFHDDPSRLLRVARYAARLQFAVEATTRRLAQRVAASLSLDSARVCEELERTLVEPEAGRALVVAGELGVTWLTDPATLVERFAALDTACALPGAPTIPVWVLRLGVALRPSVLDGAIAVSGPWIQAARDAAAAPALVERLRSVASLSAADEILRAAPPATAIAAAAAGAPTVAAWWAAVRDLGLHVSGDDLIAAGVDQGPLLGAGLMWLRGRLLDGVGPTTRDGQLAAVLDHIAANG